MKEIARIQREIAQAQSVGDWQRAKELQALLRRLTANPGVDCIKK